MDYPKPRSCVPSNQIERASKLGSDSRHFLAGGAVKNEARVFVEGEVICKMTGMGREVLTCDWSYGNDKFLIAGADGFVRVHTVNLTEYDKYRAMKEEEEAQGVMIQFAK